MGLFLIHYKPLMPNVNPLIFEKRCIIIVFLLDDLYRQEYMAFWSILEKGRLAKNAPENAVVVYQNL